MQSNVTQMCNGEGPYSMLFEWRTLVVTDSNYTGDGLSLVLKRDYWPENRDYVAGTDITEMVMKAKQFGGKALMSGRAIHDAAKVALKDLFKSMDQNGDGLISMSELDDAITIGNFSETILHDLRGLRSDLAITGDQQINYRDFVAMTMDRSIALRDDNMKTAFQHFGHSDAEHLTLDDLAQILGGEAQAREVMVLLDTDRDGKVSFEDFRRRQSAPPIS
jgi:Ca2+-binding EF-hand superfamily protein